MLKGLYGFSQIIEDVRQEIGAKNLRNQYPEIRQLIARAEREINPYGGFLIRKRMIYHVGNGNFDGKNIKKPADYVQLDKIGCCEDGICSGKYIDTVSHIVLCDGVVRTKIAFTYWGLQSDGDGNPVTSYNHAEAVVAYIVWKLYSPKVFNGEGSQSLLRDYQRNFEDRCGESRGEDFFPSMESLKRIRQMNQMTSAQLDKMFCEDSCSSCDCIITVFDDNSTMENKFWWWQMNGINSKITQDSQVTEEFLATKNQMTLGEAINGFTYTYPYIGQLGFCIEGVEPNSIKAYDVLGADMVNSFNVFYQTEKRRLILVTKDFRSQSSTYFKFNYNGQ